MCHLKVIFVVADLQTVLIFMEYADIKKEEHYVQVGIYKYGGDTQIWIYKNDFLRHPLYGERIIGS